MPPLIAVFATLSAVFSAMGLYAASRPGTGDVVGTQLPGNRGANHATLSIAYLLHFGEYGDAWVQWLYFLLGIGGAFLFYSGNLLWIESRRKRRQAQQGTAQVWMAKATVGFCIGVCVALAAGVRLVGAHDFPARTHRRTQ